LKYSNRIKLNYIAIYHKKNWFGGGMVGEKSLKMPVFYTWSCQTKCLD